MSAAEPDSWDLVLAMTRQHLRALERLAERVGVEVIPDAPGGERGVVDLRTYRSYDPLLGAAGSTGDTAAHPSRAALSGSGSSCSSGGNLNFFAYWKAWFGDTH